MWKLVGEGGGDTEWSFYITDGVVGLREKRGRDSASRGGKRERERERERLRYGWMRRVAEEDA